MSKHATVCGAGGFIGHHLVKRLKDENYSVRGIDRKRPQFEPSPADEFLLHDLREMSSTDWMLRDTDEIYQLAAEMGGMGFIGDHANDALIMRSSSQINLNVLENARCQRKPPKLFFSSSACVYPASWIECREDRAYPADPDSEYGWEKLYAERLYLAYARCYQIPVRIARIHNCYGPLGSWTGGREKAPAALCRKVAEAPAGGSIQIWGDGTAQRSFMYIDDCVEGIRRLMARDSERFDQPVNLGSNEIVSIRELLDIISDVADKPLKVRCQPGPVGVPARNSHNARIIELLGWAPSTTLAAGIRQTYPWVADQVAKARGVVTAG